jgi:hypothetical protein
VKRLLVLVLSVLLGSPLLVASTIDIDQSALAAQSLSLYQDGSLYDEIADYLNQHHEEIAQRQLRAIDQGENLRVFGGLNHVGLGFTKGFADFSIQLRRDVAPDLFDDERWLVTDTFSIYLDASHVMGKLAEASAIDLSEESLALFAGITFKRTFEHMHFADNYQEALAFNLDRLFFSFLKFRSKNFLDIAPGEFLKKVDSISLQAGGAVSAPLTSGLAARVGALVKYQKMSTTSIQGILEGDASYEGESLRVSTEKSSLLRVGASAAVVAQFLGVLQATILSVDFEYSLEDVYKAYLSFGFDDRELLRGENEVSREVENVLQHKKSDLSVLAPFLVSEERRRIENKSLKYGIVFFGGKKEAKTSHIQLTKDGKTKTFFRHNYLRTTYRQNVFSRLFDIIVKSFLKANTIVNNSESESDKVRIEYDNEENLIKSQGDLEFSEEKEKLSLNFIKEYYTYKYSKRTAQKVQDLMEEYSGSDPLVARKLREGDLQGPINFETNFTFGHGALSYFHSLNTAQVYGVIDKVCKAKRKKGIFSLLARLLKTCERKLKRSYDAYEEEWRVADIDASIYQQCEVAYEKMRRRLGRRARRKRLFMKSCMQKIAQKSVAAREKELPIWRFKDFANLLSKNTDSKVHFYNLFGLSNVHVHGEFSAKDKGGKDFIHYFREGNFSGTGLIQNTLKNEGLRSPASTNYL